MIAAGVLVDARGAAELAPDDDADIAVEAALMDVFDKSGDVPLIEDGEEVLAEVEEVAAVRVPEAVGLLDAADAWLSARRRAISS